MCFQCKIKRGYATVQTAPKPNSPSVHVDKQNGCGFPLSHAVVSCGDSFFFLSFKLSLMYISYMLQSSKQSKLLKADCSWWKVEGMKVTFTLHHCLPPLSSYFQTLWHWRVYHWARTDHLHHYHWSYHTYHVPANEQEPYSKHNLSYISFPQ